MDISMICSRCQWRRLVPLTAIAPEADPQTMRLSFAVNDRTVHIYTTAHDAMRFALQINAEVRRILGEDAAATGSDIAEGEAT